MLGVLGYNGEIQEEFMDRELQTMEEIEKNYPNEWVLIVDCEIDTATSSIKRGRVVSHGRERDVHKKAGDHAGNICIRHTGGLLEDVGVMS